MIGREHQHFHLFIVLVLQYGGCDVMWKRSVGEKKNMIRGVGYRSLPTTLAESKSLHRVNSGVL